MPWPLSSGGFAFRGTCWYCLGGRQLFIQSLWAPRILITYHKVIQSIAFPIQSISGFRDSKPVAAKKGTLPRTPPKKRKRALEIDDITSMFGLPADDFKATLQALVDSIDTEKTVCTYIQRTLYVFGLHL